MGLAYVEGSPFPGRAMILAHVVREIRRNLPVAVLGPSVRSPLSYHSALAPVQQGWADVRPTLPAPTTMAAPESLISIPSSVARAIDDVLVADAAVVPALRTEFLRMCAEFNGEEPWSGNEALAAQWVGIRMERIAHLGDREGADARAVAAFRQIESIILRIFDYAPDREARAKELARNAAPSTIESDATQLVTLHDHFAYFQTLDKPELIDALSAAGYLTIPTDAPPVYWPAGDYLVNMADRAPGPVSRILSQVRPIYPGTRSQLLHAVVKLPDTELVELARVAPWLNAPPTIRYGDQYVTVITRLVAAGAVELALVYTKRAMRLEEVAPLSVVPGFDHPIAEPAVGLSGFGRMLDDLVSAFRSAAPMAFLNALAKVLDAAIRIEHLEAEHMDAIWLRGNLATPTEEGQDVKHLLVYAILDLACTPIAQADGVVDRLLEREKNRRLYRRLATAVVVKAQRRDLADQLFDAPVGWQMGDPEHRTLVETYFADLPAERREHLVEEALVAGRALLGPFYEREGVPEAEAERRLVARLEAIFGSAMASLSAEWRSRIAAANAPTLLGQPATPPSFEDLAALSPTAAMAELRMWETRPTNDPFMFFWSSGSTVRELVRRNVAAWLTPKVFGALSDMQIAWVLHGVHAARSQPDSPAVDDDILRCVDHALARAAAIHQAAPNSEIPRDIGQSAGMLVADIAKGAKDGSAVDRAIGFAERLAKIPPRPLAEGASPYTAPSAGLGEGRAYAGIVAAELLLAANRGGLEADRIADLYDELSLDAPPVVRAALGQYFGWFASLHPERAEAWAQHLFLSDNVAGNQAAWAGFVSMEQISEQTFELLGAALVARIREMAAYAEEEEGSGHRPELLAYRNTLWFAWVLFANRAESLADADSSIVVAIACAGPQLVRDLIERIGRSLSADAASESGAMVLEQAMELWAYVRAKIADGTLSPVVLSAFADWAGVTALPSAWRLREIAAVIDVCEQMGTFVGMGDLVEALIELSEADRATALSLIHRVMRPSYITALVAMQLHGEAMLRAAVAAGGEVEIIARRINGVLVSNHRPDLLSDVEPPAG